MSGKRRFLAAILLTVYVMGTSGCAIVWFLAGAGTAATSMAVIDENKKNVAETE